MATDKIRVGIIGANLQAGWGTRAHLPALKALPGLEVVAVCTTRQETANETAKHFGIPVALADYHKLVTHPDVDLVSVCVRVPFHHELVMAALDAGKHVFCEWPLGATTAQAIEMRDLAHRKGVRHMIGLQARGGPAVNRIRDLVAQGYVGQVQCATVIAAGQPVAATLPAAATWRLDRANGVNLMTIAGGHTLDALAFCLGEYRELSATVATQRKQVTVAETGATLAATAPDQVIVNGTLRSGAVACVQVKGAAVGVPFRFEIHGSEGDLLVASADVNQRAGVNYAELTIRGARHGDKALSEQAVPDSYRWVPASVPAGPPYNVAQLFSRLADAIRAGRDVDNSFDLAVQRHQELDAIQRASDSGQRQALA
jgi:predicted dehydrogenase